MWQLMAGVWQVVVGNKKKLNTYLVVLHGEKRSYDVGMKGKLRGVAFILPHGCHTQKALAVGVGAVVYNKNP